MQHKITTPTPDYTGLVAGVAFANGVATIDDTDERHRRALAYFRRKGYQVEEVAAKEADAPPEEPKDEAPKAPSRSASKADWLAYATSPHIGMAADDAEKLTRDELAEKFLGPKEG